MPDILAQNDRRRAAAFGDFFACPAETGGFKFIPCAFADRRPASFNPPSGFFPALRCQAGLLAAPPLEYICQSDQSPLHFIRQFSSC
jgi:hypothetical protein